MTEEQLIDIILTRDVFFLNLAFSLGSQLLKDKLAKIFPGLHSISLSWTNKIFNKIDQYIKHFCHKFNITINELRRYIIGIIFIIIGANLTRNAAYSLKTIINLYSKKTNKNELLSSEPNLLTVGVYKYSRNPMYIGGLLMCIGFSFLFDNWLFLCNVIPIYIYVQFMVIPVEEKILKKYFGKLYNEYANKVPRWILSHWI